MNIKFEEELKEVLSGSKKSLRKILSQAVSLTEDEKKEIWLCYKKKSKKPKIIGVTGTPGAGKSTFLNSALRFFIQEKQGSLGLLLIDPSSPVTQGALLGDRIRLSEHYLEERIFIRSISSRGDYEGLSPALGHLLLVLSLFPFDFIFVETVGTGQSASSLAHFVDELIFIFDPHSGDDIQHLKTGMLELAQYVVISKKDLGQAENVLNSLQEWGASSAKILSADLTQPKDLDSFFSKDIFNQNKSSQNKILKAILKNEIKQSFQLKLDQFFSKEIEDKSIENIAEDFSTFFCRDKT